MVKALNAIPYIKAAETHPDEQDFANAKNLQKSVLAKLQALN